MDHTAILEQVAAGQLSADEAARLLNAPPAVSRAPNPALTGRWLHIRVTDLDTGRPKVNVNLPLTWVEAGLKLGARYETRIAGLDIAGLFEQVRSGAEGRLVEVEELDERERVEIFVD